MKALPISIAIAIGVLSSSAIADTEKLKYKMRTPLKEKLSSWNKLPTDYGEWSSKGGHYGCGDWSPSAFSVDYNESFLQTRACSQNKERSYTIKEQDPFSSLVRMVEQGIDKKTFPENEFQEALGLFEKWILSSSKFTNWVNINEPNSHTEYLPAPSNQMASFTQSRSYNQDQKRMEQQREESVDTGSFRDFNAPIERHQTITLDEERVVTIDSKTDWSNSRVNYDCDSWAPSTSTVYVDKPMTQTRACKTDQEKTIAYIADSVEIGQATKEQTIDSSSQRNVFGSKLHVISLASCGLNDTPCALADRAIYYDGKGYWAGRSWQIMVINPATDAITEHHSYDVYGDANNAIAMRDKLRSIPNGHLVLINTYDEPARNSNAFHTELRNYFGATQIGNLNVENIDSSSNKYRSSYILAGYKNGSKLIEKWSARYTSGVQSGTIRLNP